ncbi:BspA family leucine-rich repeat surface protein, partial [bacterium]|nr:BspA family leucine-rich repeat surface protein [bacterium]
MTLLVLGAGTTMSADTDDFVITVKTDNPGTSSNVQFTIPTTGTGYNYNVDIDNDGIDDATGVTGSYTCTYPSAGTYTIRIKDNSGAGTGFPRIYFNDSGDKAKLLTIEQWGTGQWTSMNSGFYGCSNLAGQANDAPDLSSVTDMSYMFRDASNFNQD